MSEKSDIPKTSPSLHSSSSYPDPADEDVLLRKEPRKDVTRPAFSSSKRHSSYTSLLTTRNFTPDLIGESRWTNRTTISQTQSTRAPSDGTSVTDDWKTALNSSTTDERSNKSRSRSHSQLEQPASTNEFHVDMEHTTRGVGEAKNDEEHDLGSILHSLHDPLATPRRLSHRLSAANLRKQTQLKEEEMRTPQPRTYRAAENGSERENHATTPDVLSELERLKKRIDSLEYTGSVRHQSPFSTANSPISTEKIRSSTYDNFPPSSNRLEDRYRQSSASPREVLSLRAVLDELRRTDVPTEVIRPLELVVADALVLSSTFTDQSAQLRATTLCRSLTTLCVALQNMSTAPTSSPSALPARNRSRSRTLESHLAGLRSASNFSSLSRARSTRKSLAEILSNDVDSRSNSPALGASRSISRASRIPDRVSALSRSEYDDTRSEQHTFHSRAPSIRSGAGVHSRTWQSELSNDRGRRSSLYGQDLEKDQWSNIGHARAPSRAATEILARSPVTRESLYARYKRSPEG